jgi:hypothetical protein
MLRAEVVVGRVLLGWWDAGLAFTAPFAEVLAVGFGFFLLELVEVLDVLLMVLMFAFLSRVVPSKYRMRRANRRFTIHSSA